MDQNNQYSPSEFGPRKTNGYAVAALVLGIVAFVFLCCCFPVSPVAAILSLVFAAISRRDTEKKDSQATVGMVLSIISLVLVVALVAFVVIGFSSMTEEELQEFYEWYYRYIDTIENPETGLALPGILLPESGTGTAFLIRFSCVR